MAQIIQMPSANGKGMTLKKFEDCYFVNLDFVDPEAGLNFAKNFAYRKGDILLCTYSKTGTHWLSNMVWKLKSLDISNRPPDAILEGGPSWGIEHQNNPRVLSTHFKPSRLYPTRINDKGKIVIMLRNPKDVAYSFFCHLRDGSLFKHGQTWDEYFQSFIRGELPGGSYFKYIHEWEDVLKDLPRSNLHIALFYYEDFLLKTKENLERLNTFLEFNRDGAYLDRVLNETTLQTLKEQYNSISKELTSPFCQKSDGTSVIFRKGQVGDWKNHFTVSQSETVDSLTVNALPHGLISFKYELQ